MDREERLAKRLDVLEQKWGVEITLVDEDGVDRDTQYQILRELDIGGKHYAVLREVNYTEPEAYIFRVTEEAGNHKIEHITEDAEWERVADAIDEMLYFDET